MFGRFAYPVTTTLLELIVTQLMLVLTASLTRTFSRILNSHGLSHLIAPEATPPKGKQRAGALAWSTSTWGDWGSTGIFGLDLELARRILPLAVIYTAKLILSNLSFAYALRQIYQLSRLATIPLTVLFTYIWANQNPSLSVTTLSSTLTLTFALAMVSLQPPFLVTWEGVVAGVFSSFFVAGYPVLLLNTYNRVLEYHSPMYDEVLIESTSTMYFQGDGKSPARSHWKLLLYTNMMAIILTLPWIFISGEAGNISRNCYILDIPWFWLMILVGGIASWGVFVGGWMLVKATTPLTGNVVGGVRVAVQSVLLSGFRLPEWSWTGAVMAISSGVWYLLGRRREVGVTWGEGEVMWEGERDRDDSETVGNWAENQRNV